MPGYHSSNGFGTNPQPDPTPAGAERLAVRQRPAHFQTALNQPISDDGLSTEKSKPEIPKKSKHVEVIYRLKQQLGDLQSDHDHLRDSFDWMALDMDEAEQNLAAQTKELEDKDAEIVTLRQDVVSLSAQLNQEKRDRVSVEQKLKELERSTTSEMPTLAGSLLAAVEHEDAGEPGDAFLSNRRTNYIVAKIEELKDREAKAIEAERYLTSQLEAQSVQLEEQTMLRERAEVALAVQRQQRAIGLEVDELRRLCKFYQEISQRLSKQIKLITTAGTRD